MLKLLSGRHQKTKILALSLALCLLVGVVLPLIPTAAVEDPSLTGDPVQITEETSNPVNDISEPLSDPAPGNGTVSEPGTGDTEPLPDGGITGSEPDFLESPADGDTTSSGPDSQESPALEGGTEAGGESELSSSESLTLQLFNSSPYYPPHLQVQSGNGAVNSEVAIDVILIHPGEAVGYSLALNYDPAIITPVVNQEGTPVFEAGELGQTLEANVVGDGQLMIAAAGTQPAAMDPVRLCTLHFRLLEEGESLLTPLEVEICDDMGQQISGVTMQTGTIQISYPVLSAPVAVPAGGNYNSVQRVSLRASDPADYIYFTLDGSDPADPENAGRQLYSSPILVNRDLTINTVTFREGRYGEVVSFEYYINLAGISGNITYCNLPMAGIPVKLKNESGVVLNSVNTNSQGGYAFPALRVGTYIVVAGGSGGFSMVESEPIILDENTRQFQQDFILFKDSGTITGVVQVPGGFNPADITVYAQSDSTGSYANGYTEEDGSFRLEALEPAADYQVFTRNDLGLIDASVADVEITAGQPTALIAPLVLGAQQLATLSGIVSEVGNQQVKTPIAGMWISVYSPSTNCWGDAESDANGRYSIQDLIAADDYFISYYMWDENLSGTLENVTITSGSNTKDIEISAGFQISGKLSRDSGSGEPTAVPDTGIWVSGPSWGYATTDENGIYTIKHLSVGTYTVEVDMWDTFDVDSRTNKMVTLDDDNSSATHDIILIPGGTISGTVTTNPPGGQNAVVINAHSASKNIYRRATTDSNGNYIIRGISPADDYCISAWKWPYDWVELDGIVVSADGSSPVVDLKLNHPDLQGDYFKLDSNRYLAMTPSIAPEKVASFKLDYQNSNPSQTAAGATAEFVLPAGLSLVANSVTLNGATVSPTTIADGNKTIVSVYLGNVIAGQKGSIVFQAQHNPATSSALALVSQASIKWSNNNVLIGSAQVEVVAVDINAPSFTKPGKFTVYGKCAASAQVKVMAKRAGSADILLGQARAEGKWWTTSVDINQVGNYQLYAIAEKEGAVSNPSNLVTVEIKDNTAVLQDVTINAGWNQNVKSNPKIGIPAIAVSQGYTVYVDAVFTNPLDTSLGNPQLLFAINDESLDLSKATPADFQVTGIMSSSDPAGQQTAWNGSFYVDYTLSGDLKAYIYYCTEGSWHLVPVVQIAILIDPSGIITDAQTGLPIEGVRAECEYEVSAGNWQRWPAENYGQVNPQFTDAKGYYGWDVPAGTYRVRFSHPDYKTIISDIVIVPPPKTDLNLGLTSLTAAETPGIKTKSPIADDVDVRLDSKIMVEFTKDMKAETVTEDSFKLQKGVEVIGGTFSDSGREFTFTPSAPLEGTTTYTVYLTADIKDTFNNPIEPAQWSFTTMAADIAVINVAPQLSVYARSTATRPVNVSFAGSITAADPPQSLDIQIAAENNPTKTIATISASVGGDGLFNASWPIPTGLAEGVYQVRVWYDNQRWGNQSFEIVAIEAPTADKPDGTEFDTNPLQVSLSCTTSEAQIYYTTDGTIPDITNPAHRYTGPIILENSTTIKAIAVKNGVTSEMVPFSYTRTDECFIATASFGSKFVPAVVLLRQFRDQCLLTNSFGQSFVEFYYRNSPPIAHYIADRPALKVLVRGLLTPAIGVAYLALHPQTTTISFSVLFLVLLAICISRRRRATT